MCVLTYCCMLLQWDKWRDPNIEVDLPELSGHILMLGVPASHNFACAVTSALYCVCCMPLQWDKWRDPIMEVDLSELSGHILVLGVPASQDGLLSLLAVLRSKRLLQWRPVVIVDSNMPVGGGSWEAVAQFSDVYFIQVSHLHLMYEVTHDQLTGSTV